MPNKKATTKYGLWTKTVKTQRAILFSQTVPALCMETYRPISHYTFVLSCMFCHKQTKFNLQATHFQQLSHFPTNVLACKSNYIWQFCIPMGVLNSMLNYVKNSRMLFNLIVRHRYLQSIFK